MNAEGIRQKLLVKFREVAGDRTERILAVLSSFESGGGQEALAEVARELHTLKGEARMMGFSALSSIAHLAEDLLELLPRATDGKVLGALLRACEAIPFLLDEEPEGGSFAREIEAELRALVEGPRAGPPPSPQAAASQAPAAEASPAAAGGAAPEASLDEARPSDSARPPAPSKPQPPPPPTEKADPPAGGEAAAALLRSGSSIRIHLDALDEIAGLTGDVMVEGARSGTRVLELRRLLEGWSQVADRLLVAARNGSGAEEVADLEDELHRLRTEAFRFFHRHAEAVADVRELLSTLAERVAQARMIPLSGVFADLPAKASKLAREHGKEIVCVVEGGDTRVDKSVIPSLNDPLIHLVRNAIDHGIESPEERVAAGKSPEGNLRISARPDGDRLEVVLEDDGRGIDPDRVRQTALERNLISPAEAAAMSRASIIDLVFHPGFSTRKETSEISGRGVGLDVVRRRVVALGGTVTVQSEVGKGTRFILRLPQSVALMKVLLFRIDDDVFGLPAVDVEGVGRIEPDSVLEIAGVRTVRYNDRFLPIVALGPLLALNGGPQGKRPPAVFVWQGNHGVALVVDGFVGDREVAVKAPSAFIKGMRYVSGAAAMEDGRVALLLSAAELIAAARNFGAHAAGRQAARKLRVLLVDDSLLARETEAALLRSQGHEVDEAADGEEAWQKLNSGAYDLLITDVQMPNLDGIALTRRVKSSHLRHLPVVILSSLAAPQDLRRGAEAGADAYIAKSELDGEKLAATIERLCGTGC